MGRWWQERRRSERTKHDSVFELYDDAGRLIDSAARLVDLSSTGAKFAGTELLAKGRRIRGRVRLLRVGALDITGRIVRVDAGTNVTFYGVEFDAVRRAPRSGVVPPALPE
jgi:hypothetical protein